MILLNCSTITGFLTLKYLWTSFGWIYWIMHSLIMVCILYLPGTYDLGRACLTKQQYAVNILKMKIKKIRHHRKSPKI
jgi:TM2 domain-containing membrane protein YozV